MSDSTYPKATRELSELRRKLAPETEVAFQAFSQSVFSDGALSTKTKQLIAVAVPHVTQCPYCVTGHTKVVQRAGATPQKRMAICGRKPRLLKRGISRRQMAY